MQASFAEAILWIKRKCAKKGCASLDEVASPPQADRNAVASIVYCGWRSAFKGERASDVQYCEAGAVEVKLYKRVSPKQSCG